MPGEEEIKPRMDTNKHESRPPKGGTTNGKFVVRVIGGHAVRFMRVRKQWVALVVLTAADGNPTVFGSFEEAQDRAREVLPWGQFKVVPAESESKKQVGKPALQNGGKKK